MHQPTPALSPALARHSRRSFLALAAGGVLVACGGSGSGSGDGSAAGGGGDAPGALIVMFPSGIHTVGRDERLAFGLADAEGIPMADGPAEITAELSRGDGSPPLATLTATRHADGVPRGYYPFTINQSETGVYALNATIGGAALESMFTLVEPGQAPVPGPGDAMPPFDTPTVDAARGVDPICSRPEPCPFHQITLTEALASGRPVAYLVGTPAHCQTGTCGPLLDLLMEASGDFPDVTYVHADVYADDAATTLSPAVQALALTYEPLLFLIGAGGDVRRRLDVIADRAEIRDGLADLSG